MSHLLSAAPTLNQPRFRDPSAPDWVDLSTAFAGTGGWVTGNELADLILRQRLDDDTPLVSQPISLVARWIVSGRVITIGTPWGDMLPLFQFDLRRAEVRPGVAMVCTELQGALDDADLALWFVTPNEWLGGEVPALALRTRLPQVRRAARRAVAGD